MAAVAVAIETMMMNEAAMKRGQRPARGGFLSSLSSSSSDFAGTLTGGEGAMTVTGSAFLLLAGSSSARASLPERGLLRI